MNGAQSQVRTLLGIDGSRLFVSHISSRYGAPNSRCGHLPVVSHISSRYGAPNSRCGHLPIVSHISSRYGAPKFQVRPSARFLTAAAGGDRRGVLFKDQIP